MNDDEIDTAIIAFNDHGMVISGKGYGAYNQFYTTPDKIEVYLDDVDIEVEEVEGKQQSDRLILKIDR